MAIAAAVVVFIVTCLLALLNLFANGMSDAPGTTVGSPGGVMVGGSIIAALILSLHWIGPHLHW